MTVFPSSFFYIIPEHWYQHIKERELVNCTSRKTWININIKQGAKKWWGLLKLDCLVKLNQDRGGKKCSQTTKYWPPHFIKVILPFLGTNLLESSKKCRQSEFPSLFSGSLAPKGTMRKLWLGRSGPALGISPLWSQQLPSATTHIHMWALHVIQIAKQNSRKYPSTWEQFCCMRPRALPAFYLISSNGAKEGQKNRANIYLVSWLTHSFLHDVLSGTLW